MGDTDKYKYIAKGVATIGIWAGVGVACMYSGVGAVVALFAMVATLIVWD